MEEKRRLNFIVNRLLDLCKDLYPDKSEEELRENILKNEEIYKNWDENILDEFIATIRNNI